MQSGIRILLVMGLCLVAGIFIAGCAQQATPAPTTTTAAAPAATATSTPAETAATAGIPNPASVNCGNLGGTLEIKKDASGGEYGMCTFQNGTSCEEWALFRGEGCKAGGAK
jgi:putative hemolysin